MLSRQIAYRILSGRSSPEHGYRDHLDTCPRVNSFFLCDFIFFGLYFCVVVFGAKCNSLLNVVNYFSFFFPGLP